MSDQILASDDDAPLLRLLEMRHGILTANMTEEQVLAKVRELRQVANSPATITAAINTESAKVKKTSIAAKRKAILDEI